MPDPSSTLLDALSPTARARLFERSSRRALATGQHLFITNDREHRAYLLTSGVMKLGARNLNGHDTILFLAFPGELVGDVGVLDGLPQPHEAIATTRCEVVGLDGDVLTEVLEESPAATLEVARCLAQRLRWVSDAAFERSSSDVPARLAGRLLDLADVIGEVRNSAVEMEIPLHQRDLGRLAGMCRESACKTLSAFKKEGVIDYRGRRLRILRPDVLEKIRCAERA